jgi:hypothetical protein
MAIKKAGLNPAWSPLQNMGLLDLGQQLARFTLL